MRTLLLLGVTAGLARAAVIQGSIVENQTGHAVARANVMLEPVAGSGGTALAGRTNRTGIFQFQNVRAGSYIITASRTGFATVQYGQKHWKAAGKPITVAENDTATVELRLPHLGAISGTVVDENDVGLPDYEVAYRDTHPPQAVAHAIADDRGMFRISALPPGRYLVRSGSKQYDDASYLPTFGRESATLDQAFPVQVDMDETVDRADVRPLTGRLYTYSVTVATVPPGMSPVQITFASELGREVVQASSHTFGPVPAGSYELFVQAPLEGRPGLQEEYRRITLNRSDGIALVTRQVADTQINFRGDPVDVSTIHVLARRNDLAGPGEIQEVKLDANRKAHLGPGPWQLALQPDRGFYVTGFEGPGRQAPSLHPEGWNDLVAIGGSVNFTLSSNPGSVRGTVAPVFLEPVDLDPTQRIVQTFVTRADVRGQYRFTGLSPGNYRLMASFDFASADSEVMTVAGAKPVRVQNADVEENLDLYVQP
jgi:hypothetical protein